MRTKRRPPVLHAIRTHLEVAKALGLSRRQVQMTESKALRKLRRALGVGFLEGLR
jgi:DNA-directed RNA polymerase sigma subunit (sigma70/sigma32)